MATFVAVPKLVERKDKPSLILKKEPLYAQSIVI